MRKREDPENEVVLPPARNDIFDVTSDACLKGSALDSIHQNHLGREGLRWNDGKKLRSYDNMPTYPDDPSVLFVWEIASKLFTQEMVSINLLFDCSIIKHFTQFYADISHI